MEGVFNNIDYTPIKISTKKLKPRTYILISTIVFLICIIIFNVFSKSNKQQYISKFDKEEVKSQLGTETFDKMMKLSNENAKFNEILNNLNEYPKDLLEFLAKRLETIDFVYNYPKRTLNGDKSISVKNDYTKNEIPLFLQWDKRWGYDTYGNEMMAIAGCAPTALSMAIVGITGNTNITPLDVAKYSYENNYYVENVGTSWNLVTEGAKHFGIKMLL